jgi:hypothetical protein
MLQTKLGGMAMQVTKAKYVVYVKGCEEDYQKGRFSFAPLLDAQVQELNKQMQGWYVRDYSSYTYEYDDYDDKSHGSDLKYVAVSDMVSCVSGIYSTSDVLGDILINQQGQFVGVIVKIVNEGGNGWNNYRDVSYALLFTDGRVVGKAEKCYSFSGESSSKERTNSYDLVKREN